VLRTQDPAIVRLLTIILAGIAAVMAWLGWFAVAPALGLPELATAAMVNRDVATSENPGFWLGWLIVLLGLGAAVVTYFLVTSRFVKPRLGLGLLRARAVADCGSARHAPLGMGSACRPPSPPLPPGTPPPPQAPDPMHASFMMLDFSNWAPVSAAVAWLMFGAILGAVSARIAREPT
jgi:hypothetical protein